MKQALPGVKKVTGFSPTLLYVQPLNSATHLPVALL